MKNFILFLSIGVLGITIARAQYITDYDGNVYDTISIGTQTWLKQNLKVTHFNDGTPIPNVSDSSSWANLTTGARCYYLNDSAAFDSVYGALYNWYAVNNSNICPTGWHVSTNAEWHLAETFLGGESVAGGEMKEAGTVHWLSPNAGATNNSQYTGLPGGMRDPNSSYSAMFENGLWWTATNYNSSLAWSTYMWYMFAGVDHNPTPKKYGLSIRCIKNNNTALGDVDMNLKIRMYPNPAHERITIQISDIEHNLVSVVSNTGQIVIQKKMITLKEDIDISNLSPGIYFIHLSGTQQSSGTKFIRE